MRECKLSDSIIIKFSLLWCVFFMFFLPSSSSAGSLNFTIEYDEYPHEAPSWDPSGTQLKAVMNAAADIWSDIIKVNYDIRVHLQYEEIDAAATTSAYLPWSHGYDTNGNGVNDTWVERIYNAQIRVNPDRNWFVDPTPLVNEEFEWEDASQLLYRDMTPAQQVQAYDDSPSRTPPDLLEAAYYMEATSGGPADGKVDMLSVLVHELGHVIGFNDFSNDVSSPYRLEADMVWGDPVYANSETGEGDQNANHINTPDAIMSYNWDNGDRYFPSATDVLVPAKFCHWTSIDMPRKDFVDVHPTSSPNYWSLSEYWTGDRVPDAEDEVWIRNGVETILNLTDGVARVLTISEGARLIIRGDRTLSVQDLKIEATGTLKISSTGGNVAFVDADGAPAPLPIIRTPGSIELGSYVNQAFRRLTIHDEDLSDGITPHLNLEFLSTLTLNDHLELDRGVESLLSDSTIAFTHPTSSMFRLKGQMTLQDESSITVHNLEMLNGRMTLEDESSVTVHNFEMRDTGGVAPELSVLSGSTFEVTDTDYTADTVIPVSGSITVSGADSSLTLGSRITAEGTFSLSHGTATMDSMKIESTGTLSVRFGGLLDISSGDLRFLEDSNITISDIGTLVKADSLLMSTPVNVAGAARLETSTLSLLADIGDGAEAHLELNGTGPVLTTDTLILKSGTTEAARVEHNSGIVTISDDIVIQDGGFASTYTISGGSITVDGDLRMLADSTFTMNLNGGALTLGQIDQQGNAGFTLNLNGGSIHLTGLGAHAFDKVNVATRSADDVVQTLQDRELSFNELKIGYAGDAEITMRGPTTVNDSLVLAYNSGSSGQLTFDPISEFTTLSADTIIVGLGGVGTFIQTNGDVLVDPASALIIGRGSYELEGGRLFTDSAQIGAVSGHSAWFFLRGGRHNVEELKIGIVGSTSTYQIDSGRLDAEQVIVTDTREGVFIQNNGMSTIGGNLVLGNISGRDATVTLNDGSMTVEGELQIGKVERGRGTFTHNGGSLRVQGDLHVGYGVDSFGVFNSYDSMDVAGNLIVGSGEDSEAQFRIVGSDGESPTLDIAGGIQIAGAAGSVADFYVVGSGLNSATIWLTDQDINVGPDGVGILHMAGGRIRGLPGSQLHIHPGNSVQGFGRIDIPADNLGAIINSSGVTLSFMESVSGEGVVRAEGDIGAGTAGRIEFWGLGKIQGAMLCDGTIVGLGLTDSLEIRGGIHGEGQLDAVGNVELYSPMDVARVNVSGRMTQHDHDAAVDELRLQMGTYTINAGTLETTVPMMVGVFEQMGGDTRVIDNLVVGLVEFGGSAFGEGTLLLDDGSMHISGDLQLGVEPDPLDPVSPPMWGTVRFTSEKPHVEVEGDLIITAFGRLETVPGATIHLTGSNVYNTSQDPMSMAGLSDLQLSFAGDGSVLDTFEVAGDPTGDFVDNFALGQMQLGGATRLQLVDLVDNGRRAATGSEALFLVNLMMSGSSTLDINGLDMFVQGDISDELIAWIDADRIFDGTGALLEYHYDSIFDLTVVVSGPLPGDTNDDDLVDIIDYDNLIAQFGAAPGIESADFNGDGHVDLADFVILRGNFGFGVEPTPDAEFGAATPEPATLSLLALGGLAVIRRRRTVLIC
jgi:hypothetical protein